MVLAGYGVNTDPVDLAKRLDGTGFTPDGRIQWEIAADASEGKVRYARELYRNFDASELKRFSDQRDKTQYQLDWVGDSLAQAQGRPIIVGFKYTLYNVSRTHWVVVTRSDGRGDYFVLDPSVDPDKIDPDKRVTKLGDYFVNNDAKLLGVRVYEPTGL